MGCSAYFSKLYFFFWTLRGIFLHLKWASFSDKTAKHEEQNPSRCTPSLSSNLIKWPSAVIYHAYNFKVVKCYEDRVFFAIYSILLNLQTPQRRWDVPLTFTFLLLKSSRNFLPSKWVSFSDKSAKHDEHSPNRCTPLIEKPYQVTNCCNIICV